MFQYLNENFSLGAYPDEIIDILLELYNKIKEKFSFINKNSEVLIIDESLDDNMDVVLDSLNKLADMLEENPLFEDEYYLSLSIINYVEFIALDKDLLKNSRVFIANVVINFFNLISDKQDLLLSKKNFDYNEEYEEFLLFFNKQKEYFHTHIYKKDNNENDELVKDVTNILW